MTRSEKQETKNKKKPVVKKTATKTSAKKAATSKTSKQKRAPQKTTQKKPVKKSTPKRKPTKPVARLMIAHEPYCFYCRDGHVLSHLKDLLDAITMMEKTTFIFHTTDNNTNDFSGWVEHVLYDPIAAAVLEKHSDSQARTITALRKHIISHYLS